MSDKTAPVSTVPPNKRYYSVTIPMAGHLVVEVEATTEDEAIALAIDEATIDHLDRWEIVEQFIQGNVCYCPRPWEVTAEDVGPADDEANP